MRFSLATPPFPTMPSLALATAAPAVADLLRPCRRSSCCSPGLLPSFQCCCPGVLGLQQLRQLLRLLLQASLQLCDSCELQLCVSPGFPSTFAPCDDINADPEGPCHDPKSPIQKKYRDSRKSHDHSKLHPRQNSGRPCQMRVVAAPWTRSTCAAPHVSASGRSVVSEPC